jgi:2-oxo-4-hydroxy-4-carboxy--5-ureidoimidazoline (OHCU) decarboxylase
LKISSHAALAATVAAARKDDQLALVRAHPEFGGKAMVEGRCPRSVAEVTRPDHA